MSIYDEINDIPGVADFLAKPVPVTDEERERIERLSTSGVAGLYRCIECGCVMPCPANLEAVLSNAWAACSKHVERVAAMQAACRREQLANGGGMP